MLIQYIDTLISNSMLIYKSTYIVYAVMTAYIFPLGEKDFVMAIVTEGFEITVTVADNGGQRSTLTYVCDPLTVMDFTDAQTAEISIRTALQAVTDSIVVGSSIKEVRYNDAIVLPAAGVQNENKASVTLQILGQNKKANMKIPAPKPTLFVGTSGEAADQIDVTDALLTTYFGNFLTAGYFTLSDGEKVSTDPNGNGIIVGKRIHAKNNNG